MLTVKICNPGATEYIQGDQVLVQALERGINVRVSTEPHFRDVLIPDYGVEIDSEDLMGERVYILNDKGKTIDTIRQRPGSQ